MTTSTPTLLLPYPESTDPPDGPAQLGALALASEALIVSDRARLTALEAFAIGAAWAAYVPTLTQGGAVTKTVEYARSKLTGKSVHLSLSLAVTGTGTAGQPVLVGLPIAPVGYRILGSAAVYDASVPTYYIGAAWWDSATVAAVRMSGFAGRAGEASGGFTAALAAGDIVTMAMTFETA